MAEAEQAMNRAGEKGRRRGGEEERSRKRDFKQMFVVEPVHNILEMPEHEDKDEDREEGNLRLTRRRTEK
eukprot:766376-Hanusia_phi.AAC.7